ncbi:MAG: DNA cytosine methyltransferase, partial [Flavobacterium sp.]|nr:DNA cytosine methyltransferase [Flavobacterium sp.]
IIMGFPITYQFLGAENNKWRLVGNAVCCSVSRAFAKIVLDELGIKKSEELIVSDEPKLEGLINLNNYTLKSFDNPPIKNKGSRFRRQPIKDGNLTVTLSNYDIEKNSKANGKWLTSIQYGTGKGFPIQHIEDGYYTELEPIITKFKTGKRFIEIMNNGFSEKIGNAIQLQEMYEIQKSTNLLLEPTELIEEVKEIIDNVEVEETNFIQEETIVFNNKKIIPTRQLFALYAINKISTTANKKIL